MKRRLVIQLPAVLAAIGACAFVSEAAARAVTVDISRLGGHPRLRAAIELYLDAVAGQVSTHTCFRNLVTCMYLCCCEFAECRDVGRVSIEQVDVTLVARKIALMPIPRPEQPIVRALVMWAASWSPHLPQVSLRQSCAVARRVIAATVISLPESSHL
ncbi:hypothetical protein Bphyt_3866 [Paraburkholderia phytofirmans PsJN]|uniref:Lipoprotein n=1 Tax=Paraburkholderia phytofirmans (strain DSM 17436 / LMG 22146 / PsJN) TaxID=398527 RepID=B2T7H2_PARPJ|nr:hypothetical protein Bphyt_3866 [Paraburkholderia phytofirmans PsJN]